MKQIHLYLLFFQIYRFKDHYGHLANHYLMVLVSLGLNAADLAAERKYILLEKLLDHFGGDIKCEKHPKHDVGKVIFKSTLPLEKAVVANFDVETSDSLKVFFLNI